ncbi:XrtY-associated glycosyltransferase XYAG1 [Pedobacter sp. AW1-32]|uniref:XrtY-associated glycosyltransferase XYAG1 n=1 Tax=Pedobacter sp. AW1-32 TaxID=3383026 RepID=UPI003FF0AB3B
MKNQLKIIHVTPSYKPAYIYGGPIQSVGKLCEALVQFTAPEPQNSGCFKNDFLSIQVLTTTANGKNELPVKSSAATDVNGVQVRYFPRWTKDHSHFSPALLFQLSKELKQAKRNGIETVVHIHAWWNLVSVLSCLVARYHNIPVIVSPRGMLTGYTKNNRNGFFKQVIHVLLGKNLLKSSRIHATSHQEKQEFVEIVKPKSITVIPNLVNLPPQLIDNSTGKTEGSSPIFNMIFLSRIEQKKGLDLLFEALAKLEFPWRLTIAGSGDQLYIKSLKLKAELLKIDRCINWLGQISNEEKFNVLANHDLLVLTSYNENFANVVLESLSVGTAVLISDQVGLSDYVAQKNLGWITPMKISDITLNIKNALKDVGRRNEIRLEAPTLIHADFEDLTLAKKYLTLYKSSL